VWEVSTGGAGCVISTADDMARFVSMLLRRGQGLIAAEDFAALCTPRVATERGADYGLGVFLSPSLTGEGLVIEHTGGMLGYRTAYAADPQAGFGLVLLTNLGIDHHSVAGLHLLRNLMAVAPHVPQGARSQAPLLPPPALDELVGDYGEFSSWRVTRDGNMAQLRVGGTACALEWFDTDRCLVHHATWRAFELRFCRDAQGRVIGIEHGSRYLARAGTGSEPAPLPAAHAACVGTYRGRSPWTPVLRVVSQRGELRVHVADLVLPLHSEGSDRFSMTGTPEVLEFSAALSGQFQTATLSGCDFHRVAPWGIGVYEER
jgi:D-alanyl-D-alanine carboxypeptidase